MLPTWANNLILYICIFIMCFIGGKNSKDTLQILSYCGFVLLGLLWGFLIQSGVLGWKNQIDGLTNKDYAHDICTRCGKTVLLREEHSGK